MNVTASTETTVTLSLSKTYDPLLTTVAVPGTLRATHGEAAAPGSTPTG